MQLGMFSPWTRFHGTSPREPWHYGQDALELTRCYAKLRYRLLPYLFSVAAECVESGVPMMRHMALEFPTEPNIDTIDDQFALGADLLVAPVLILGADSRQVYFPEGRWTALDDDSEVRDGGRFHSVSAPLDRIPVYVRQGAVIPTYVEPPHHLKEPPAKTMVLNIYSGDSERERAFTEGVPINIRFSARGTRRRLAIAPAPVTFTIVLHGYTDGNGMHSRTVDVSSGLDSEV